MGNNVTTTPVETLKIDETNDDSVLINDGSNASNGNNVHNIPPQTSKPINGIPYDRYDPQVQDNYPEHYGNESWFQYGEHYLENDNQQMSQYENESSINERLKNINNSVPDFTDESNDVLNEMKESKSMNDLNSVTKGQIIRNTSFDKNSGLPLLRRSVDDNNDIQEIYDLESIDSSSKLTLNDNKSDTEEVIQELNKLNLDLEEPLDRISPNYRRRGQSWSNWENNVNVDLKTESSLSSFSRPASINDQTPNAVNGKTKSYTAPEYRVRTDSAIEWLAKQHGIEMGSSLDNDTKESHQKTSERKPLNKNDLKLSSFEIPGSVISLPSTAVNDNEVHEKYDDLEKQIINSIENDFIR